MSGSLVWLLVVPVTSVIYDAVSAAALRRWMKEPVLSSESPDEPVTFFRPLKRNVPFLREKLETLFLASRSVDQILLGVDAGSEEETVCGEIRRTFPDRDVTVVRCDAGHAVNPKISKLMQMAPQARHEAWLLSDSEVVFRKGFLDALRAEWQTSRPAALTTAYRFVNLTSWPQRCDAMGVLLGLWPGIALVRRYGQVDFTLGACTLFRREALAAIGGWEAFGGELAEDQRLGEALTQSGHRIRLSRQVATLDSDLMSWGDYWRHQRRVAITYRGANPAGFAGVIFTLGPVWSVLSLLMCGTEPWMFAGVLIATLSRAWRVWLSMRLVDFPVPGSMAALAIASGMEAVCWFLSWFSTRVWWSGRWWRVGFRGTLTAVD
jgi:ceramide glucosyltransferase